MAQLNACVDACMLCLGWKVTSPLQTCKGAECKGAPLLSLNGTTECVVCSGTGNGQDGAYRNVADLEVKKPSIVRASADESRRGKATAKIASRIVSGQWKLLDVPCPKQDCSLPAMQRLRDGTVECALCGPIPRMGSHLFRTSPIATVQEKAEPVNVSAIEGQ